MNRRHLWALLIVLALGALALLASRPAAEPQPAAAPETGERTTPETDASRRPTLQALASLGDQPLPRRALDIQHWQTAEGARVLFVEARSLPMFDLRLTFAAGSSQDGAHPGLALMTNAMLNEGVQGLDTTAIAAGFERLGAQFGNGAYRDMAIASLRSLSAAEQREPALALFAQVVGAPHFPQAAMTRLQNQLLTGLELQKQNPGHLGSRELFRQLYGEHPYASPSEGTETSLKALTREQLAAFHRRAYSAGNAVIALVGDLSRSEAEAIAAQLSAALPEGPALPAPPAPTAPAANRAHIEFPSQQTHLLLAQLGIDRRHPDYAALHVGNQILGGGGFGTRLMEELREKRGLTYGIYSAFTPMQVAGPFMISVQTRAEQSEATLALVRQLVREFLTQGPSAAELQRAQRQLAGSFPLSTASNADIVAQLGAIGFYGLPTDHLERFMRDVQALDVETVRAAMARHLREDAFVVVSTGPTLPQQPLPPLEAPLDPPLAPSESR